MKFFVWKFLLFWWFFSAKTSAESTQFSKQFFSLFVRLSIVLSTVDTNRDQEWFFSAVVSFFSKLSKITSQVFFSYFKKIDELILSYTYINWYFKQVNTLLILSLLSRPLRLVTIYEDFLRFLNPWHLWIDVNNVF